MKIDKLNEEIENDSKLELTSLTQHSLEIPKLSIKYQRYLYDETILQKRLKNKIESMRKNLVDYYKGYASDEIYKKLPLDRKPTSTEIEQYIKADEEYQKCDMLLEQSKMKLKIIEGFIKQINQRSFIIKNAIEWEKFTNGGY